MLDDPEIKAKRLYGQRWYEIDDIQDLDIAESIFPARENEGLLGLTLIRFSQNTCQECALIVSLRQRTLVFTMRISL